ncbi:peroxiredoxin family protein [Pseudalkalibacillus decolorationis]|uniref:peroxiredoxin family protein n=1 Tax=Pseudalkalibacillus decolorationis TaxID=163879 RepID=UPI0021486203|nr:TlpA disulfide reductase family protein [Pseudalkalibacillus decolorationis]
MWKNILPIVFLVGLVIWGVYDYTQDNHTEPENGEKIEQNSVASNEQKPATKNRETGIEQGNIAPDFTLQTLEGKKVKLSDYRGKNVIINFWATWCPPCRVEMPHMEDYYQANQENDFTILAVNMTESEKSKSDVKSFVNDFGLSFPVVLDVESKVTNTYEVVAYPTSYFVDKQGVIRHKVMGAVNQDMIQKIIEQMK